jgi:hypothetical protein
VDVTLGKPEFPKENLAAQYGSLNLRTVLKDLEAPMKRAIVLSGSNAKKFGDWRAKYIYLLSILGI